MTAYERTGWRDQELSERHRLYGFDCPAVDLDFLLIEYHHAAPVALVEYKHWLARELSYSHPSYQALRRLADGYRDGPLPFLVVQYLPGVWLYRVLPMNDAARRWFRDGERLSELAFVRRLYRLRGLALPARVAAALRKSLCEVS